MGGVLTTANHIRSASHPAAKRHGHLRYDRRPPSTPTPHPTTLLTQVHHRLARAPNAHPASQRRPVESDDLVRLRVHRPGRPCFTGQRHRFAHFVRGRMVPAPTDRKPTTSTTARLSSPSPSRPSPAPSPSSSPSPPSPSLLSSPSPYLSSFLRPRRPHHIIRSPPPPHTPLFNHDPPHPPVTQLRSSIRPGAHTCAVRGRGHAGLRNGVPPRRPGQLR